MAELWNVVTELPPSYHQTLVIELNGGFRIECKTHGCGWTAQISEKRFPHKLTSQEARFLYSEVEALKKAHESRKQ